MIRALHAEHAFSDRFITYMLSRNIRIEEDLVDRLFNSSQQRLARTLLLLARYGKEDKPHGVLPKVSQEVLAEMVGTTSSWVNFFMNKFRKLGFIKYNGGLQINTFLLSVVLHDLPLESIQLGREIFTLQVCCTGHQCTCAKHIVQATVISKSEI
jgi:CRP/FNR family cyclic AMP-dependent transcriptional regulator